MVKYFLAADRLGGGEKTAMTPGGGFWLSSSL